MAEAEETRLVRFEAEWTGETGVAFRVGEVHVFGDWNFRVERVEPAGPGGLERVVLVEQDDEPEPG